MGAATRSGWMCSIVEDDHSEVTSTTVSTSACPDTAAPSAPAGVRQVATTESSVVLAWTPSSDNVGVVEYGLYDSGLRVATVSEPSATRHEPRLRQDVSARDRRGRRRGQPLRPRRLVLPHLRLPLHEQATVDPDRPEDHVGDADGPDARLVAVDRRRRASPGTGSISPGRRRTETPHDGAGLPV